MILDYSFLHSGDYRICKFISLYVESCTEQRKGSLWFLAAFFALNVGTFPKSSDGTTTTWQLGHILGLVGMSSSLQSRFKRVANFPSWDIIGSIDSSHHGGILCQPIDSDNTPAPGGAEWA